MSTRGKAAVLAGATLLLAGLTLGFLQFAQIEDPEVSNLGEVAAEGDTANDVEGAFPVFFVSDPRLKDRTENAISLTLLDDKQVPLPGAPFFIQLADGRWAAGRTDTSGATPPIFTAKPERHEAFYADDAVERWHQHRPKRDAKPRDGL